MGLPLPKAEGRRHKHDGPQRRLSNTLRRFRNWEAIGCTTRAGHLVTDLESYKAKNEKVKISVVGVCNLASDIPPALAVEVVEALKVYGIFQASAELKDALTKAGKIQ